jgi:uncharacterized protein (DUF1778 family)
MNTPTSKTTDSAFKIVKDERIEARVTSALKETIARAAYLRGQSITDFVVNSAQDAALQIIKEHEILTLSKKDRQTFIEALLDETPPSDQSRADAQWYKKVMKL